MTIEENQNLRASLTDMKDDHVFQKRDRSYSNEKFELPPLPEFDDNKDLQTSGNEQQDNFMMNNYKSNEIIDKNSIFSNLAAESNQEDDFGKQIEKDL